MKPFYQQPIFLHRTSTPPTLFGKQIQSHSQHHSTQTISKIRSQTVADQSAEQRRGKERVDQSRGRVNGVVEALGLLQTMIMMMMKEFKKNLKKWNGKKEKNKMHFFLYNIISRLETRKSIWRSFYVFVGFLVIGCSFEVDVSFFLPSANRKKITLRRVTNTNAFL